MVHFENAKTRYSLTSDLFYFPVPRLVLEEELDFVSNGHCVRLIHGVRAVYEAVGCILLAPDDKVRPALVFTAVRHLSAARILISLCVDKSGTNEPRWATNGVGNRGEKVRTTSWSCNNWCPTCVPTYDLTL